jgi:hexosaminidase
MLDVARNFFAVEDIKRFVDQLAALKLNRLHLHLTDDQGWRLMIQAWPDLASFGGRSAVGGGRGGFYTQAEYADLVAYARGRQIVVVPEIDMPGHTQAALASVPELNPGGVRASPYTGVEVGFSTLDAASEYTYRFVAGVLREVAALTPGAYLHIGGDEAKSTSPGDYRRFIERVQELVASAGKQMIGWEEIAQARLLPTTIAQHWSSGLAAEAVRQGSKVILSPATRAYLDMQYTPDFPLGTHWSGFVGVRDSYVWDPAAQVPGITEADILGIEAPLWTETVHTRAELETMAFPRLIGLAEIGWSPIEGRSWEEYRVRLAAHGRRLDAMGVHYYRSPEVDWA